MTEPPKATGMSLYADLLADPQKKSDGGSTISSAPVRYNLKAAEAVEAAAPKKKDASLQFQPNIKRPQPKVKSRPHATFSSATHPVINTAGAEATAAPTQGSSIEFWLEKGNDHNYTKPKPKWYKEKKKSKKRQNEAFAPAWDDVYDPSQPNNYRAYKGSEEQYREIAEWKDRLYFRADSIKRQQSQEEPPRAYNPMFAPPVFDAVSSDVAGDETGADAFSRRAQITNYLDSATDLAQSIPPSTDPVSGEDAFARRAQMSATYNTSTHTSAQNQPPSAQLLRAQMNAMYDTSRLAQLLPPPSPPVPPPPPESSSAVTTDYEAIKAAGQAKAALMKAKLDALKPQPVTSGGLGLGASIGSAVEDPSSTISREPVRYVDVDMADAVQPLEETSPAPMKPKKAGFGQRMLEKQGWKQGQGLGANSEGITTAISVQAEKRKKRSDADGGGWQAPRNMGKIVGGKKRRTDDDTSEPGMSTVVKLPGMLHGLDVKHEIEENNLQQELGEWFNENYGTVERVHIWRKDQGGNDEVFIKFINAISALKAVNPVDALTFANNEVKAVFFDAARFDNGEYA